jgi:hypothetical protein
MDSVKIPVKISQLVIKNSIGAVLRKDVSLAQCAMKKLGVSEGSEFYEFYSMFIASNLVSSSSYESLVDVSEPTEEVALGTRFAHEVWELPKEYICFSSCQGEGGYLYSTKDHAVYDFTLANRDQFLERRNINWESFYEFITWYLSPTL